MHAISLAEFKDCPAGNAGEEISLQGRGNHGISFNKKDIANGTFGDMTLRIQNERVVSALGNSLFFNKVIRQIAERLVV